MKDAIIVGFGLAGFHYALELQKHKKDFLIISNEKEGASKNAGGVFNPTVLKRYTMSWRGEEFFDQAISTYSFFEEKYNINVFQKNRLGLSESLEGGQSLTLGTEYKINETKNIRGI